MVGLVQFVWNLCVQRVVRGSVYNLCASARMTLKSSEANNIKVGEKIALV